MWRPLIALLTVAAAGCAEVESVPPPSVASTAVPPRSVGMSAAHGGSVLLVDDQWVEVVARSDGALQAYFLAPVPAPSVLSATEVTVRITDDQGTERDVPLAWNDSQARFEGDLGGAPPPSGPIEVFLVGPAGPVRRARALEGRTLAPSSSPPPTRRSPQPARAPEHVSDLDTRVPHRPPRGAIVIHRPGTSTDIEVVEPTARDPDRPPPPSRPGRIIMPRATPRSSGAPHARRRASDRSPSRHW